MGVNALDVKQSNVAAVLSALYGLRSASVKDLAARAGLSQATVGSIMTALVEGGKALPGESAPSRGGRPARIYAFNAEYAYVLALSARARGETQVISGRVADLYGASVWQAEKRFGSIRPESFEAIVGEALRLYPAIRILAVSLPGVEKDGVILFNDYKALEGLNFVAQFESKYGLRTLLENDVNAALLGYGQGLEPDAIAAGLYFPRRFGPGAALLIEGKALKGARGFAGEIARLPLGIDWHALDYGDPLAVGPAVAALMQVICCVADPQRFVLYGDFFTADVREAIRQALDPAFCPALDFHGDFDADIMRGLLAQALAACQQAL
ncbi:MAG: ROK family protein [Candidatus Pelethousia sp.]|nr:ROK family protein [Candidatus Pelethousia sp.]